MKSALLFTLAMVCGLGHLPAASAVSATSMNSTPAPMASERSSSSKPQTLMPLWRTVTLALESSLSSLYLSSPRIVKLPRPSSATTTRSGRQ